MLFSDFSKHHQKWGLHTVPFWYIYICIYYAWTGKVFLWLFVFVVLKTPDASQNQYRSTRKFCDFVLWSTVRNSTPRAATKVYLMRFTTIHIDILDWIVVPVANSFFEHDVLYVVDVVLLGANRLISKGTRKDKTTLDAVLLRIRACKVLISPHPDDLWHVTAKLPQILLEFQASPAGFRYICVPYIYIHL